MLRGAQTAPELLTRSDRLADFPGLDDVRATLERLSQREPALVVRIPRSGGQREDRYMHLLCGDIDVASYAASLAATGGETTGGSAQALEARIEQLENLVDALQQRLQQVEQRFDTDTD